ncbi:hypothetical protein [Salinisphaera sp. LB1]|uniref:hypothetical protein n=1 Tax=Salinisphaera sp. LB1 TaxID=2183911 RepID=UPI000D707780|nr:hypothetical protein [Salinisphaera sp. LB1]AWN15384.1 Putative hemolysin [Salinisphaera sp. LB1]
MARVAAICRRDALDALSASRWLAQLPRRLLLRVVARRIDGFARQLIEFDDRIASDGLAAACAWGLGQWAGPVSQHGEPAAPGQPLLLVSNHPGLVDAVALLSRLAEHDVRLLVAERPLFHALPALRQHLIMVAAAGGGRAFAVRAATRHLRAGGTLLTYPAGRIEPDPASDLNDALTALECWSPSASYLARRVPELRVQPVTVSHVIAARYRGHWLAHRAANTHDRDAVAAALQVLSTPPHGAHPQLAWGAVLAGQPANALHAQTLDEMARLMRTSRPSAYATGIRASS